MTEADHLHHASPEFRRTSGIVSWTGPGDPFWRGRPHHARISTIQVLTDGPDSRGRSYWRVTDFNYRALNAAVDKFTTYVQ